MKFRFWFHVGVFLFVSMVYVFIFYEIFYVGMEGVPLYVELPAYAYLICSPITIIPSTFMKAFIWRNALEVKGENLIIVRFLWRSTMPIASLVGYEIRDHNEREKSILIKTKDKYIPIYPAAIDGGVNGCRKFLESLGISGQDKSGGYKHVVGSRGE